MSDKRCCVVIYPAERAGRVSYLFGVFESEELARAAYFGEDDANAPEVLPPHFIDVPFYTSDDRKGDSA